LGEKKLREVYLDLADFCLHHNLRWSPFTDIINGLKGKDRVCTFMGCDPFHTQSAMVVLEDGSISNCMRTNKEYILLRHPARYNTRDEILENIDQKYGGCKNCKYWNACRGGCPSSGINNDWRNRTHVCSLWKALFQFYENILNYCDIPVLLEKPKQEITKRNIHQEEGVKEKLQEVQSQHGDAPHGDHSDDSPKNNSHGDIPYGDIPHGDIPHGDK